MVKVAARERPTLYTCLYPERSVGNSATFVCNLPENVMVNTLDWKYYPSDRRQDPEMVKIDGRYILYSYM